jgi:hypothetical protein
MARLKLYYPTDEITSNLYTTGKEWMTINNIEYVGSYHLYTTGEAYTQPEWNPRSSIQLIPYQETTPENVKNIVYQKLTNNAYNETYVMPSSIPVQVNKQDILNGFISRFFLKKHNESIIIETNHLQYQQWQSNIMDSKLYSATSLTWFISGNINDERINGYLVEGVATKNKKEIRLASLSLPEILNHLTNLTEYYVDNVFTIATDINGLES